MGPTFHIVDYIVFAVSILASLGIGIYFAFAGKKNADNQEFLMGGRNMKLIPVAISLVVSFLSTISKYSATCRNRISLGPVQIRFLQVFGIHS